MRILPSILPSIQPSSPTVVLAIASPPVTPVSAPVDFWHDLSDRLLLQEIAPEITLDSHTATLTELIQLLHLADYLPDDAVLLAQRRNPLRNCGAASIRLYFGDPQLPLPAVQRANAIALARQVIVELFTNTEKALQPLDRGSRAARVLSQYARAIARASQPQRRAQFSKNIRTVAEVLHAQTMATLPAVGSDAPRAPTDCLLRWIAALRTAAVDAAANDAEQLQQLEQQAQQRWLQHDLTIAATRDYFKQLAQRCASTSLAHLSPIAAAQAARLPTAQQQEHFAVRLNDNVFGRVFETRVLANLLTHPAPGTAHCMRQLAHALADLLQTLPRPTGLLVAKALRKKMLEDLRFWYHQSAVLSAFFNAGDPRSAHRCLMALLSKPVDSGFDCICIVQVAIRLSLTLAEMHPSAAPWMGIANPRYTQLLNPAARRLANRAERVQVREGGILLAHQAPAYSHPLMQSAYRATLQFRPNLDSPSAPIMQALQHGIPYATGVSGSTNILLHLAAHLRQRGTVLPMPSLLLAGMMLFNGGHSLHEVLWVAHRLDHSLQLNLQLSAAAPDHFIADYTLFFSLFDGPDRAAIDGAVAQAWTDTLAYMALEDDKLAGRINRTAADA